MRAERYLALMVHDSDHLDSVRARRGDDPIDRDRHPGLDIAAAVDASTHYGWKRNKNGERVGVGHAFLPKISKRVELLHPEFGLGMYSVLSGPSHALLWSAFSQVVSQGRPDNEGVRLQVQTYAWAASVAVTQAGVWLAILTGASSASLQAAHAQIGEVHDRETRQYYREAGVSPRQKHKRPAS